MKHVIFQKGFRPFFLLGGLAAVWLVPWWAFHYQQPMSGEPGFESIAWHSHEMIFGFTAAILAGFLLTAVENWLFGCGWEQIWLTTDVDRGLRAYGFYRHLGWVDWKVTGGIRYMRKAACPRQGDDKKSLDRF